MAITRQSVIDGPGTVTFGALKLHAEDNIDAVVKLDTWRPSIATHGDAGPRLKDATGEITFKPTGRITQGIIDALYPTALRSPTINTSMHGAADVATIIHSTAGKKVTFTSTALGSLPELTLSPAQTAIGSVKLNAVIGNGLERTAASSLYVAADLAWSEVFPESEIICVPYTGVWNSQTFYTEDGWKVAFDLGLEPRYVDGIGTIDHKFKSLTVRASCKPVNITAGALLGFMRPQGLALGANMRQTQNLVITGASGGLIVTLYDAVLMQGPCQWGKTRLNVGEIGFEASRLISGGDLAALFAITLAA
jgi:hypothetical protein